MDAVGGLSPQSNRRTKKISTFWKHEHSGSEDEIPYPDNARPKRMRPWRSTDGNASITAWSQTKTIFAAWSNVLLPASIMGIILHFTAENHAANFAVNLLGIMPLTSILVLAQEELGLMTNRTWNAIITALLGTAPEFIVAIVALSQGQILVAEIFLVGSMLFHLLLSLGLSLLFGGLKHSWKYYVPPDTWYSALQILLIVAGALVIPSIVDADVEFSSGTGVSAVPAYHAFIIRAVSRGTASLLLVGYCCWMYAQTKQSGLAILPSSRPSLRRDARLKIKVQRQHLGQVWPWRDDTNDRKDEQSKEELDAPRLTFSVALATLLVSLALLIFNCIYMVASIDGITCHTAPSKAFLSVAILPGGVRLFSLATAVIIARHDYLSLSVTFILGDSLQIGLLVLPICALLSWSLNDNIGISSLPLYYAALLFLAAFFVLQLLNGHVSHWFGGLLAVNLWMIVAISTWYDHPPSEQRTCRD